MWYKLWCRTVWIKLLKKPDVFPLSSRRLPENLRLKLFRWACQKKGIILACCAWSICVAAQWTSLWECYLPGEKVSQTLYDTDSNWIVSQWVHEICNHRGDRARCVDPVPSFSLITLRAFSFKAYKGNDMSRTLSESAVTTAMELFLSSWKGSKPTTFHWLSCPRGSTGRI